jgi:hypothetical protein
MRIKLNETFGFHHSTDDRLFPMEQYTTTLADFGAFVRGAKLVRKAAYSTVSYINDGNPRSTKFGGKYPRPPADPHPKCDLCDQPMMMIVQLYVPTLPDFIQAHFPAQARDQLIVLGVCPECLGSGGYSIRAYGAAELDGLAYHDDIGEQWAQPDLQSRRRFPRVTNSPPAYDAVDQRRLYMNFSGVGGWTETEMVPDATVDSVRAKLAEAQVPINERIFIAAHDINMKNGIVANCYLGGWPHYCGEDQTPGDDYVLLLNISESENATLDWGDSGTAQIWMGVKGKAGEFKFTCSSF